MTSPTTPTSAAGSANRRRLGRGLGSLISSPVKVDLPHAASPPPASTATTSAAPHVFRPSTIQPSVAGATTASSIAGDGLHSLPIASIVPNPRQPRQHFDEAALQALASSIRTSGVMQPIVVRPATSQAQAGGQLLQRVAPYELIAGERRWRAAQVAGLTSIPAVVRDVDDRTAAEFSLVENLQREDLNPIERAEAFRRLMREFHLTHAEIAERVGLDRSSITNHLRLLELGEDGGAGGVSGGVSGGAGALEAVRSGRLSMGHAKALLAITNFERRERLAAEALRCDWSVRELERRVREMQDAGGDGAAASARRRGDASGGGGGRGGAGAGLPVHLSDLQKRLAEHLGTKVAIHPGRTKGAGKLVLEFYSIDQFEGLLRRMSFEMEE